MKQLYTENAAPHYPVSIKGVVLIDGKIPLLRNERDEFELPGGKLEPNEQPQICLVREINEELSIDVYADKIIDSWLYTIRPKVKVLIVTYGCILKNNNRHPKISSEHKELIMASPQEVMLLNMPDGYKKSITTWLQIYDK